MDKKTAEKHERMLAEMLQAEENKYCADCGEKGTRWASWNLGVFLCIRCGGLHRRLGTHISRIKSVNLDAWTAEQIQSMQAKGNKKMNAIYMPHPEKYPFPQYESEMEQYIRDKYERKIFVEDHGLLKSTLPAGGSQSLASGNTDYSAAEAVKYKVELKSLWEMGFNDTGLAIKALAASKGNVPLAIDYLVAASQSIRTSNENEDRILKQLMSLGYSDRHQSLKALSQANGNLDEAIKILSADSRRSAASVSDKNLNGSTKNVMDDLLCLNDEFAAPSSTVSYADAGSRSRMQPNGAASNLLDKDAIMSLYDRKPTNPFQSSFEAFPAVRKPDLAPHSSADQMDPFQANVWQQDAPSSSRSRPSFAANVPDSFSQQPFSYIAPSDRSVGQKSNFHGSARVPPTHAGISAGGVSSFDSFSDFQSYGAAGGSGYVAPPTNNPFSEETAGTGNNANFADFDKVGTKKKDPFQSLI